MDKLLTYGDDPEQRRLRLQESLDQREIGLLKARLKAAEKEIARLMKLLEEE